MDDIFGWHGNFIKSCSISNESHLVILFETVCPYGMFKTNLDFANLCLYNELDEISFCFILCDVWELCCVSTRHQKLKKYDSLKLFFCYIQPATLRTPSKNPLLRFPSAQKTFFHCFYIKEHHSLCTTEIIPPFAQNGTSYSIVILYKVKRWHYHCTPCSVCKREKFDQFNTS